jgi:hypothetical protein
MQCSFMVNKVYEVVRKPELRRATCHKSALAGFLIKVWHAIPSCRFTLVFSVSPMLAGSTSIPVYPTDRLAYPIAIQDYRVYDRGSLQIHWLPADVAVQVDREVADNG